MFILEVDWSWCRSLLYLLSVAAVAETVDDHDGGSVLRQRWEDDGCRHAAEHGGQADAGGGHSGAEERWLEASRVEAPGGSGKAEHQGLLVRQATYSQAIQPRYIAMSSATIYNGYVRLGDILACTCRIRQNRQGTGGKLHKKISLSAVLKFPGTLAVDVPLPATHATTLVQNTRMCDFASYCFSPLSYVLPSSHDFFAPRILFAV